MKPSSFWLVLMMAALPFAIGCGDDEGSGTSDSSGGSTGAGGSSGSGMTASGASQLCVDKINEYRATLGLMPYARWTDQEACAGDQAKSDAQANEPHGAFGKCGESAQNECPGWAGPPEKMIGGCLDMMWAEGPGSDFSKHGHYINMSSTGYTQVACGFFTLPNGDVWAVQNFK